MILYIIYTPYRSLGLPGRFWRHVFLVAICIQLIIPDNIYTTITYILPLHIYYHYIYTTIIYILQLHIYYHYLYTTITYILPLPIYYHYRINITLIFSRTSEAVRVGELHFVCPASVETIIYDIVHLDSRLGK